MSYSFDVPKAIAEVQQKSLEQIEGETAYVWGSRALACLQLHRQQAPGSVAWAHWLLQFQTYRDEAIEHAAFASEDVNAHIRAALSVLR